MAKNSAKKFSPQWICQTRKDFRSFLKETKFPNPARLGERGPEFEYPEWLIMFIAILSVKCKLKSYLAIHRMAKEYWPVISQGLNLKLISERRLRGRLKKSAVSLASQQRSFFKCFLNWNQDKVASADKMMNKAKGHV